MPRRPLLIRGLPTAKEQPTSRAAKLHREFPAAPARPLARRSESVCRDRREGRLRLRATLFRCCTRAGRTIGRTAVRSNAAADSLRAAMPDRHRSKAQRPPRRARQFVSRKHWPRWAFSTWKSMKPSPITRAGLGFHEKLRLRIVPFLQQRCAPIARRQRAAAWTG